MTDGPVRGCSSLLVWIALVLALAAAGFAFRAHRENQAAEQRIHELELRVNDLEDQSLLDAELWREVGGAPTARPPVATPRPRPTTTGDRP